MTEIFIFRPVICFENNWLGNICRAADRRKWSIRKQRSYDWLRLGTLHLMSILVVTCTKHTSCLLATNLECISIDWYKLSWPIIHVLFTVIHKHHKWLHKLIMDTEWTMLLLHFYDNLGLQRQPAVLSYNKAISKGVDSPNTNMRQIVKWHPEEGEPQVSVFSVWKF